MIVGRITFAPDVVIAPRAVIGTEVRDLGLGVWKTLGLEITVDPVHNMPEPCFDLDEMRRRNDRAAKERARTLVEELDTRCN